jgi:TATA-box binding protein (TBP) (component of TFIID and TFIIIB)
MDAKTYAEEYLEFMEIVHRNRHVLNVSTITLICDLNVDNVNIQQFCQRFDEPNIDMKHIPHGFDKKRTGGRVRKSFYNQVTLNYKDISKKSMKIFSNGKLQITGLTSYFECEKLADYTIRVLHKTLDDSTISIRRSYIGMINCNFSTGTNLDLYKFNQLLNRHARVMSIYSPESYPAINMKYRNGEVTTSVFIFGTGNIVITGGKCLLDMKETYEFVHKEIVRNYDTVSKNTEHIKKPARVEEHVHGYSVRQYMSCVY